MSGASGDGARRCGRLEPCPRSPNCVSSRAADARHRVAPIGYHGSREHARALLLETLAALPRTRIECAECDYVRATQRSRLFGFVDDIEFELPAGERLIHVRSASRSGFHDLGVNRARVDRLRRRLNRLLAAERAGERGGP